MENVEDLIMLQSRIKNICEGFDGLSKSMPLDNKNLVLIYLHKHNTASNFELTFFLNFAKSNVANICKQLLNEGLIEQSKSIIDNRNKRYELTQNGKECCEEIIKQINDNIRSSIQNISALTEISYLSTKLLELLK